MTIIHTSEHILDYWFGDITTLDEAALNEKRRFWFNGGEQVDHQIQSTYIETMEAAASGTLAAWQDHPRGTLALIILLDQFPLNAFRKTTRAYDYHTQALAICQTGLNRNHDVHLLPLERVFFYLPLVHSERIENQDLAVQKLDELVQSTSGPEHVFVENSCKSAAEHRQLIVRFGRYPHRNQVLGRVSTPEEADYLAGNPQRFGQ